MNKPLLLLLAGSLLSVAPAWADGDWDRARTAHERGDYAAEVALIRPLAEKGFAFAQFNLGVLYDNGQGLPQDDVQAISWYRKAAEQGLPQAQVNLGIMYEQGEGVPADKVEAYFWYALADSQGDGQAPQAKRDIAEKMSAAQIEEAERRLKEFKASHSFTVPPIPEIVPETKHGNG
ncbi:MAG TPA: tetratricopeptide repeat protein [Candidatus Competibacter sp.]|nr:sel1 repeat family protein [Candidatus Competibacteraceae bacterium]HRW65584.1 tetratricopeptide repeat protein [Candidatus Competibacter sp.]